MTVPFMTTTVSQRAELQGRPLENRMTSTQTNTNRWQAFALLAVILSAIGIYGLIAYSVSQRTHEIGIRMALGARSEDVLRMVLREGLRLALIGGTAGLVLALPLPSVFAAISPDLHNREPWLYIVVAITILAVAVLATYLPARRAARIDPMHALRQE